jgi:hypothetical protein
VTVDELVEKLHPPGAALLGKQLDLHVLKAVVLEHLDARLLA